MSLIQQSQDCQRHLQEPAERLFALVKQWKLWRNNSGTSCQPLPRPSVMKSLPMRISFTSSCLFSIWIVFGDASRPVFPTPTFAGLRAAQADLGIKPTPDPLTSPHIVRRLSGDPAICGWVEGHQSKSSIEESVHPNQNQTLRREQTTPSPATLATPVLPLRLLLAVARLVLLAARCCIPHVTTKEGQHAVVHAFSTVPR